MFTRTTLLTALAALSLSLTACGGKAKTDTTPTGAGSAAADTRSLYERLGGQDAITAVVDDMVANIAADTRINTFFANADITNLKAKLVEQICAASGGPCTYTGKSMKESHTGMGVKEEHFNALVEDLVKALDKYKVQDPERTELLTALGGMKGDIVTP